MRYGFYEIEIQSSHSGVYELAHNGQYGWVGVPGATYTIRVTNHKRDYRLRAHLTIDGLEVMKPGWGKIAEPGESATWKGFRIDDETIRDFLFSAEASGNARGGIVEITIKRETIEWSRLNPPPVAKNFCCPSRLS